MSNVSIEPGAEVYKGSFSLRFAPKPEDKYVPKNYDEECICTGLRLLSEGKTEEGLRYVLIAWADEALWSCCHTAMRQIGSVRMITRRLCRSYTKWWTEAIRWQ